MTKHSYAKIMTHYVIVTDNEIFKRNLETLIPHYGLEDIASTNSAKDSQTTNAAHVIYIGLEIPTNISADQHIKTPVRIGKIIDLLKAKQKEEDANKQYDIASYKLSATNNVLALDQDKEIRLTDTETQILIILAQASETSTSKQTLLQKVWGYRPDLDTHTVETHIYRLRQKIETNPANPAILLTTENGYALAAQ